MKIIEEPWVDFDNSETVALSLEKDEQYTISEFIELLKSAQEKFGDKKILIHDMNSNTIGGFSHVYLHHGFDEREKYGEITTKMIVFVFMDKFEIQSEEL